MFIKDDFLVFNDQTLDGRLEKIRTIIDPKFEIVGSELLPFLEEQLGVELYLHIAKHARRSKNPPPDTWMAFSENKRGYKMMPHFEIGFWNDRLFIWLSALADIKDKSLYEKGINESIPAIQKLEETFLWSVDHTNKETITLARMITQEDSQKWGEVKTKELLIGQNLTTENKFFILDEYKQLDYLKETLIPLIEIYKIWTKKTSH
ncbi:DUF1054 family protein [Dellaglioa sp. BT-FLS60]